MPQIPIHIYFPIGSRVATHPGTHAWLAGDRYGTVARVTKTRIHVDLDISGRRHVFTRDRLRPLDR